MISKDVIVGENVSIPQPDLVNLYGCEIGAETKIGAFVEIQKSVKIGRRCKVQSYVFIPPGVTLEDGVFVGPHVCFTNDLLPRAVNENGELLKANEWTLTKTLVKEGAAIGANSTIVAGVTIGKNALIGAGSVVTKDIPDNAVAYGNPARVRKYIELSSNNGDIK